MTRSTFARTLPASRVAGTVLAVTAVLTTLVLFGPQMLESVLQATPHGLDVPLFMAQPAVIKIHMLAALVGVGLGATILTLRKGNTLHRTLGWTWTLFMATAAASSLFIVGLNGNHWSPIHLLSGWTLIILPFAVRAARKHDVMSHRRAMTSLFWGASIVAGAFTFLPGRLMWRLFFG